MNYLRCESAEAAAERSAAAWVDVVGREPLPGDVTRYLWSVVVSNDIAFLKIEAGTEGSLTESEVALPSDADFALWLDPRANLFTEITGLSATTPAVNTDPVGTWRDKLDNGNFIASPATGQRGSLNAVLLNDIAGVQFDGSQGMKGLFTLEQPCTVVLVFRDLDPTLGRMVFDGGDSYAYLRRYNPISRWDLGTRGTNINGAGANSDWHVVLACFNGDDSKLVIDNVLDYQCGAGDITGEAPGGFSLAAEYTNAQRTIMDVGAPGVFVVRGALSAAQQEEMFSYIADVSGLPLGRRSMIASGGLGYNAWPSLVRCANDDLLCFFSSGTAHNNPDQITRMSRSTDNGLSWTVPRTILDIGPDFCCSDVQAAAVLADGTVLVPFSKEVGPAPRQVAGLGLFKSTDNGETWSAPWYPADPTGFYNCVFYGTVIEETPGGTLLAPIWAINIATDFWHSLFCQSVDAGLTWTVRGDISAAAISDAAMWNETSVVRISGDNYVATIRNELGKPTLWHSATSDGGVNWSAIADTDIDGVSPFLYKCANGDILEFCGDRKTTASTTKQTGIKARRSTDAGDTWGAPVMLYSSPIQSIDLGYPAVISLGGGRFGMAYYDESHEIRWLTGPEAVIP